MESNIKTDPSIIKTEEDTIITEEVDIKTEESILETENKSNDEQLNINKVNSNNSENFLSSLIEEIPVSVDIKIEQLPLENMYKEENISNNCIYCAKEICGCNFASFNTQTEINFSEKPFVCNICNFVCSAETSLQIHIHDVHYDTRVYECYSCDFISFNAYDYEAHIHSHRKELNKELFRCELCGFTALSKGGLKNHMHVHTRRYRCKTCHYESANRKRTYTHYQNVHVKKIILTCPICKRRLLKTSMKMHLLIHTGEKPFKCEVCKSRFRHKNGLQSHMRQHNVKPFHCKICNFRSLQRKVLNKHVKVHSRIRPFECSVCKYRFYKKTNLIIHVRKHTGEKPYNCELCDCKFTVKTGLRMHKERKHSNTKLL